VQTRQNIIATDKPCAECVINIFAVLLEDKYCTFYILIAIKS